MSTQHPGAPVAPDRPNVIWIFGDQHRAQALGLAGDPNVHTPNIDRLAGEGVYFPNAVGGCPLCSPYRGSLLSGRYPHNAVPAHQDQLDPILPTIAKPFREAGYRTSYFGKWHVDGFKEKADQRGALHIVPRERRGGFDDWVGYENNNAPWDSWVHGHLNGKEVEHHRLPGYETDELTEMMLDYIDDRARERSAGQADPFFAVLSVQPPHDPYIAPAEWMERHTPGAVQLRENVPHIERVVRRARRDLAGYYAMIENLDWNVGRIIDALLANGMYEDTHIIVFSDHGDMHGSHGMTHKTNPYEESLRVPMVFGGGRRYAMKTGSCNAPINHVDMGPTSLGLCGIDVPDWMQGTDYSHRRVRKEAGPEPDSAFCQLVVPTGHGDSTDRPWRAVVTRDGWKYACLEGQPWLMFNLNEDPYEQANLAHNTVFGGKRKELDDRLRQWIADTGDEFEMPRW